MSHRGRISKRSDGRQGWRFEVDTIDPTTGKRRRTVRAGFKTKGDAAAALDAMIHDRDGGKVSGRSPQVGAWLRGEWLPAVIPTVEATTARLYTTTINAYVIPHIGGVRISDVTGGTLTGLYGRLAERLAPKTIRNTHGIIHRAFKDAVRWGLLTVNPADAADPPKVPQSERETWTAAELNAFLAHVGPDRLTALFRVLATTGLRRGEAVGLRWQDVNLEGGFLSVVRSRTEYGGQLFESDPKTAAGRRRVSLDPGTLEALRDHRNRQRFERRTWGDGYQDFGLVFAREDGSPIRPATITRQLSRLSIAARVPRATPHVLRHTWATLALEAGVHPKVVSQRLGHASIQITLDLYSHVIEGLDQAAAVAVASMIDGAPGDIGVTFARAATGGNA